MKKPDILKLVQQMSTKMFKGQELCKEVLRKFGLLSLKKAKGMADYSLQLTCIENKENSPQRYRTKRQEAMAASCKREIPNRNKRNSLSHKGDSLLEHVLKEAGGFQSLKLFEFWLDNALEQSDLALRSILLWAASWIWNLQRFLPT